MSYEMSGLYQNDTLERYAHKNNGRLPTSEIKEDLKECKDNKALKIFKEKEK